MNTTARCRFATMPMIIAELLIDAAVYFSLTFRVYASVTCFLSAGFSPCLRLPPLRAMPYVIDTLP